MKVELGYKWEAFSESVTDLCLFAAVMVKYFRL